MMWWIFAVGAAFGVIGGMGLGGGIILVPALVFIFGVSQHDAQALCLAAFLPASASALFLHIKNKMICFKKSFIAAGSGALFAFLGAKAAVITQGDILKLIFGGILVAIGIYKFVTIIRKYKTK